MMKQLFVFLISYFLFASTVLAKDVENKETEDRLCENFRPVIFSVNNSGDCKTEGIFRPAGKKNNGLHFSTNNHPIGNYKFSCSIPIPKDTKKLGISMGGNWKLVQLEGKATATVAHLSVSTKKDGVTFYNIRHQIKNGKPKSTSFPEREIIKALKSRSGNQLQIVLAVRDAWKDKNFVTGTINNIQISFKPECPVN